MIGGKKNTIAGSKSPTACTSRSDTRKSRSTGSKKKLDCSPHEKRLLLEIDHPGLSLTNQAKLLGIARSTAYYIPRLSQEDDQLMKAIDEIYTSWPFYGSRRIRVELRRRGHDIGRDRIRSLMRRMGIKALFPGPNTSKADLQHRKYPYLLRGLPICRTNQVWGTDITYIRMHHGFLYLVAIIDWFSRYVISFRLSNTLEDTFCIETLSEALRIGKPEIHNSDQGSQFTGLGYLGILLHHDIKISMDGKGRALDNIFTERLWRSLKYEEVYLHQYQTPLEAYQKIKAYFHFYNYQRPHQALNYQTPAEVYFNPLSSSIFTPLKIV